MITIKKIISQARKAARSTNNNAVKCILNPFTSHCPNSFCHSDRSSWKIDIDTVDNPPIDQGIEYDLVRYRCQDCGAVFKKIELK